MNILLQELMQREGLSYEEAHVRLRKWSYELWHIIDDYMVRTVGHDATYFDELMGKRHLF